MIERAAPTDASVLISGERGTGKAFVARTIHELSPRAAHPYVAINCAAIPEGLLEREIFGHEQGADTGAVERRQGCFELDRHGTLYLDELADMATAIQAQLLRVVQERSFCRLGGHREQPVDVRLIAATSVNARAPVARGSLREDLFYRINVLTVTMPPLCDRREDIPLLVRAFAEEFGERDGAAIRTLTYEAMRTLERYFWPGNIRELRNVIERAMILATGDIIDVEHPPPDMLAPPPPRGGRGTLVPGMRIDAAERRLIEITLEHTGNNKTRAAKSLGISVKTLHNKLHKFRAADAAALRTAHR